MTLASSINSDSIKTGQRSLESMHHKIFIGNFDFLHECPWQGGPLYEELTQISKVLLHKVDATRSNYAALLNFHIRSNFLEKKPHL
jgi:hypothetical protein